MALRPSFDTANSGSSPCVADETTPLLGQNVIEREGHSFDKTGDPPDGGYGWTIVLAVFLINAFTWGTVAAYSVYLGHYLRQAKYPQATPVDFALIGGCNFAVAVLSAPAITYISRSHGPRVLMFTGVLVFSSGFIAASYAAHLWQLYISQGVLVGLGVGLIYIPSIAIVSQWFSKKRSLANGICAAGSGIGGLASCFATETVIKSLGTEWALRITAVVVFAMNLLAVLLIRTRDDAICPTQKAFDLSLLRDREFRMLLGWSFVMMFGYVTLMFSLPDFARAIQLSNADSAATAALLNLGAAIGRPLIGFASDRYGRVEVSLYLTVACAVMCALMWIPAETSGLLFTFAMLCGAILGVFWAAIGPLAAEVVGLENLQSALSLSWLTIAFPTFTGEVIALKLRGLPQPRPYLYPQVFTTASYAIASLFLFELVRSRQRKEKQTS